MKSAPKICMKRRRQGFTIVELLVALALVMFIMSIVSQAFVDASESFRNMRAKAELSEKLRFVTQSLRADLRASHFENFRRMGDDTFWDDGPPKVGYFRLEQAGAYLSTNNGTETVYTSQANSGTLLAFTAFMNPSDPKGFHSISLGGPPYGPPDGFDPAGVFANWKNNSGAFLPGDCRFEEKATDFNSPSAEIAWFTSPIPETLFLQDEPATPQVQLFKLYRKVWPLLPQVPMPNEPAFGTDYLTGATAANLNSRLSVVPKQPFAIFNSTDSLKSNTDVPMRRSLGRFAKNDPLNVLAWKAPIFDFLPANWPAKLPEISDYLIADNVVSFTVEVMPVNDPAFQNRFVDLQTWAAGGSAVVDTWSGKYNPSSELPVAGNLAPIGFSNGINGQFADFVGTNVDASGQPLPNWKNPSMPESAPLILGKLPRIKAIRVTIRLYDTNNALSPSKTTWQATIIEPL